MQWRRSLAALAIAGLIVWLAAGCGNLVPTTEQAAAGAPAAPLVEDPLDIVSAEAIVVPAKQADLSFKTAGRVAELLVSEGEAVVAGQELARLETLDLEQAVRQAQAEVESARAQLAKVEAGARPEEIAAAEAAVAIAESGVAARQLAVLVAEGNVASAQATVSNTLASVAAGEKAVNVALGNLSAAQASQRSAEAALAKLVAGPTERDIQIAEKQIEMARNQLWGYQGQRDALGGRRDYGGEAEYVAAQGQVAAAESLVQLYQLELDDLRAGPRQEDVAMARAQVEQAQANVQTARAQWEQATAEVESIRAQVAQAQAGLAIAQAQRDQAENDVETARAQVRQAQAQLDLTKAGSRMEDVAVAKAAVVRAEAALGAAQNALDDAVLRAPFGGTIGAIHVNPGELASPQFAAMQLGDQVQFRVETEDLSEVDVSLVREGQPATVTVDALEGKTFTGTVARIAPLAVDRRGDKVYTVNLDLGAGPESGLRWGMSAFVEIDVE